VACTRAGARAEMGLQTPSLSLIRRATLSCFCDENGRIIMRNFEMVSCKVSASLHRTFDLFTFCRRKRVRMQRSTLQR